MGKARCKYVDHCEPTPAKRRKKNDSNAVPAFTLRRTRTGRLGQRREALEEEAAASSLGESTTGIQEIQADVDGGTWEDIENGGGVDAAVRSVGDSKEKRYKSKSSAKGTIHVKLNKWLPYRQKYLDEILRHNGRLCAGTSNLCRECSVEDGSIKCKDCYCRGLLCPTCVVKSHRYMPFHRLEVWNGDFFEKTSLRALGLRVQLGHDAFDMCSCGEASLPFVQLLRAGLFPATIDRPRTAFTFDMLDTFHELTLQGKTNAYDFYKSTLRRTDNGKPATVYRYNEFAFVVRLWRHLTMLKRGGRGHDPRGVDATSQGELAVECPACPQPGRNLPPDWRDAPPNRKWLYKLFLAVDANFKLKQKDRSFKDIELAPGWVYFVEEDTYQRIIATIVDEIETNTCRSEHNAIVMANIRNILGYQTNGTGAVLCGRHSLVRRNGVADLSKGEKYASMDYIVLSTLVKTAVSELLISYDIGCQWSKKLASRIKDFPQQMQLDIDNVNVRTVVPKFHLPAHGVSCQTKFSLNFIPYVGRTYGEGVESEWAHINGTATSTREMAPAVRHETLNDHWSSWNWQKWLHFGSYFNRKLREALKWRVAHEEYFVSLTKSVPNETVTKWEAMIVAWNLDQTKPDPYEEPTVEMTLNDVRLEFANEDAADAREALQTQHAIMERSFISMGIDLEERQRAFRLRTKSQNPRTSASAASHQGTRNTLHRQILQWRTAQDIYMPGVAVQRMQIPISSKEPVEDRPSGAPTVDIATDGTIISAENLVLNLPSSVPALANKSLQLMEGKLRVAQADDALETIRRLRRIITGVHAFKNLQVNGTGNKPNTRMHTLFQRYQTKIKLAVDRYRCARAALLALDKDVTKKLDPKEEWGQRFQELKDADVRGPGRNDDQHKKLGEGRTVPSWIWAQARSCPDRSLGEFGESVRVEWAKAKARVLRWEEEIILLSEEMRRVLVFLTWKADDWLSHRGKRDDLSDDTRSGVDAYAAKQAAIMKRLAFGFAREWIPLLRKLNPVPNWVKTYHLNVSEGNEIDDKSSSEDDNSLDFSDDADDDSGGDDELEYGDLL
ncbi:hypothetical protein DFH11DRAFT_1692670 [Phellopilus nigrolimitatus]|nr:hypothetical protein DFH11DRAFT_1692670 [Phellopilus nigrolimitatus]